MEKQQQRVRWTNFSFIKPFKTDRIFFSPARQSFRTRSNQRPASMHSRPCTILFFFCTQLAFPLRSFATNLSENSRSTSAACFAGVILPIVRRKRWIWPWRIDLSHTFSGYFFTGIATSLSFWLRYYHVLKIVLPFHSIVTATD
jgi:hypothetical protein